MAQIVTLQEMDEHWTLIDLADCHEALDIQQEAEDYEYKKTKKRS